MPNFILIDGSYFIFYRYFAIQNWFAFSHKNEVLDIPAENADFVEKFRNTFISKIKDIPKKLHIENPIILVGKDCPRKKIWRMKLYADYKKNRVYDDSFMGGPFFEMAYKEDLFLQGGAKIILEHESLEADDCVALTTKHILSLYPDAHIWIITSDMDYLQLSEENVHLYNLKFKKLTDSKTSFNDPKKDLFCKIVTGDKSDCIPSVFKRCGLKTASKYYENKMLFMEKLVEKHAKIRFALNRKLIDFNEIPKELVSGFNLKYGFV